MKKNLFAFLLLTSYLLPLTCFSQANTYVHDRIDTTIYAVTTNAGNAYTGTNLNTNFNVAHYNKGLLVSTFIVTAPTGAATYKLVTASGTLSTIPIRKAGGTALSAGDIPDSSAVFLLYYGSFWRLVGVHAIPSTSWLLTGNSGTVDGTNFIGTTDNIPFNIRVNNNKAGRIESQFQGNTFYGYLSGNSSASGKANTGFGKNALQSATGTNNTGVGEDAVASTTSGANNTGIGYTALNSNATGSNNTAIGYGADVSGINLSNATAIGANAIVSADNSLVLGNNAKVGIGISSPSGILDVVGGNSNFNLTGAMSYTVGDNAAGVFSIKEGSNKYFNLNTTNASELIEFGNATTNPTFSFLGTGAVNIRGGLNFSASSTGNIGNSTNAYGLNVVNATLFGTAGATTLNWQTLALTGNWTAATQSALDNSNRLANTAYVDAAVTASNPAVAVQAATTTTLPAYTYNNGVGGVGAFITITVPALFVVDSYTFTTIGQRVLIKNETAGNAPYNGVYYVSVVGSGILSTVLIRALDYDMPSDINNTGAIPVVNGTVNTLTSWLLTSSVTTVGTDPLTYTQFTLTTGVSNASTITNDVATSTKVYPTWVNGTSGNLGIKVSNTKFTFYPSTGVFTLGTDSATSHGTDVNSLNPTTFNLSGNFSRDQNARSIYLFGNRNTGTSAFTSVFVGNFEQSQELSLQYFPRNYAGGDIAQATALFGCGSGSNHLMIYTDGGGLGSPNAYGNIELGANPSELTTGLAGLVVSGINATLNYVGMGTLSPSIDLHLKKSISGVVGMRTENTNTTTLTYAVNQVIAGTTTGNMNAFGQNYVTTAQFDVAKSFVIRNSTASGNVSLVAQGATGGINVWTDNNTGTWANRWSINAAGHETTEGVTSTGATGSGKFVFDTNPVLVTPNIGTPSAGTLTNCTATTAILTDVSVPTDVSSTYTVTGWSGSPTVRITAAITGKVLDVWYYVNGTSNATTATITMNKTSTNIAGFSYEDNQIAVNNSGALVSSIVIVSANSSVINCYADLQANAFTASGVKQIRGHIRVPIQ